MDRERFLRALEAASARGREGIGTLGEKGVHNTLKHYYEPDPACHEVPVGGFVADIVGENGIIEIQTASFFKMKEKLSRFLEAAHVTIVWPCVVNKRIIRVDGETGEVISTRRSNVHRGEYDIFRELSGIREFLKNPSLSICIAQLEADEYRPAEERKGRRKRGAYNGVERYPTMLAGEILLESPEDYLRFLPAGLTEKYTAKSFASASGLHVDTARYVLSVLTAIGVTERCGKENRAYVYRTVDEYRPPEGRGASKTCETGETRAINTDILNQPLDGLDGQMCVAMAANVPLKEVIERTGCGRWQMNAKRVVEALGLFGVPNSGKLKLARGEKRPELPDFCIISERGHFLLHHRGIFYDNSRGMFENYDQAAMTGYIALGEEAEAQR